MFAYVLLELAFNMRARSCQITPLEYSSPSSDHVSELDGMSIMCESNIRSSGMCFGIEVVLQCTAQAQNVLLKKRDGSWVACLADFGIGRIESLTTMPTVQVGHAYACA